MVTIELHLPSNRKDLPGSFRQIDPVAALQHVIENQRVSRPPRTLAADSQEVDVSTSLQLVQNLPQASQRQNVKRGTKCRTLQATTPRGVQHSYSNDGVRLSELGEEPLAVDSGHALDEQQELSFSLPDPGSPEGCHSRNHDVTAEQLYSKHRSYVCNTKDDPLVKGRPALPDLFRQKGAFTLLQPSHDSGLSFPQSHTLSQPQQPILLQNLHAFLAEKLQMADRLQLAYSQPDRSSLATANLVLDAHRQVFEAFIHSFTTYRPLLLKIRGAYEEALQDALACQADNIHMKAQLAALHQRKARRPQRLFKQ
ncbi:hypothetical protein ABBQ32_003813 [Trebouxia sp. C0010 RCD-2024]